MIRNFEDFCRELNTCGFSMGGGNAKGIFTLIDYDWLNQDTLDILKSQSWIPRKAMRRSVSRSCC